MTVRLGSPEIAAVRAGDWILTDFEPWNATLRRLVLAVREGTRSQSGRKVDLQGIGEIDAAWVREIVEAP